MSEHLDGSAVVQSLPSSVQPHVPFSLSEDTLRLLLTYAKPLGHNEDRRHLNLGFGFLYYGLVRAIRPAHVLVVGSGFGFSVISMALALRDNGSGAVTFVDPSFSLLRDGPMSTVGGRGAWDSPSAVRERFACFGVEDIITHYRQTNAEFFPRYEACGLPRVNVAFIDGNHSYDDVTFDFAQILARSARNSFIFLHDTRLTVREFVRHSGVGRLLEQIRRRPRFFEFVNLPFSSGVALVRVRRKVQWDRT